MTDERTRRAILARRARFLAAALTTLPLTACDKDREAIGPDDVGKAVADTNAASTDPTVFEGPPDAGVVDAPRPRPCLKMAMPRDSGRPHVCLRMIDDD